jgi:hypothetical protein
MKLMKVKFTEWRDPPAARRAATPTEMDTVQATLAVLAAKEAELKADFERKQAQRKIADSEALKAEHLAIATELDNLVATQRGALATQKALGQEALAGMKAHPMTARFGYQVLNDAGTEVLMLVDEAGEALPEGAVYGYEIVDQDPPSPAWVAVKEAEAVKL